MGPHTWRQPPRSLWPRHAAESRSGSGSSSWRTHGGMVARANARERSPRSMMPHALVVVGDDCLRRGTLAATLDRLRRRSGRPSGVYPHTRRKRLARGAGWRLSGRRLRRPPGEACFRRRAIALRRRRSRLPAPGIGRRSPLLRSGFGCAGRLTPWLGLAWLDHQCLGRVSSSNESSLAISLSYADIFDVLGAE